MTCIFYPFYPSNEIFENGPDGEVEGVQYIDVSQYQNQINRINAAFAQASKVTGDANFSFPNLSPSASESEMEVADGCIEGEDEFFFENCVCDSAANGGYCQCYYDDIDRRLAAAAGTEEQSDGDESASYESTSYSGDEISEREMLRSASDSIQPPFVNPSDFAFAAIPRQETQYFGCIDGINGVNEVDDGEEIFEFDDDSDSVGDIDSVGDSIYDYFVY